MIAGSVVGERIIEAYIAKSCGKITSVVNFRWAEGTWELYEYGDNFLWEALDDFFFYYFYEIFCICFFFFFFLLFSFFLRGMFWRNQVQLSRVLSTAQGLWEICKKRKKNTQTNKQKEKRKEKRKTKQNNKQTKTKQNKKPNGLISFSSSHFQFAVIFASFRVCLL